MLERNLLHTYTYEKRTDVEQMRKELLYMADLLKHHASWVEDVLLNIERIGDFDHARVVLGLMLTTMENIDRLTERLEELALNRIKQ